MGLWLTTRATVVWCLVLYLDSGPLRPPVRRTETGLTSSRHAKVRYTTSIEFIFQMDLKLDRKTCKTNWKSIGRISNVPWLEHLQVWRWFERLCSTHFILGLQSHKKDCQPRRRRDHQMKVTYGRFGVLTGHCTPSSNLCSAIFYMNVDVATC